MLIHNQYRISKLLYGGDIDVEWIRNNEIIHIGCEKSTPPVFGGKWLATYSDSHTESAECDASSAITGSFSSGEIPRTNLVSVEIGDCVTEIGEFAFYRCSGITSVTIPDSVTSISAETFEYCTSLKNAIIGNGVTQIGTGCFTYCTSLTSCTIGNGVTSIGVNAFNKCTSLTSVTVEATTPPSLRSMAFNDTSAYLKIYVPAASVDAYKSASGWSDYANRIQAIGG